MIRALRSRLSVLRSLRGEQSGLSMTELLVSALITSVLLIMVGSFFVQTAKLTTAANQTRVSNGEASNITNTITSVLGVATTIAKSGSEIPFPAVQAGTRSSVTVFSYANTSASSPQPTKVTYSIDSAGVLTEVRCTMPSSGGYWNTTGSCTASKSRVLGTIMLPTGTSDQLFTYRDGSGNDMLIGTGSLSATQLAQVSSIVVNVSTQAASSNKPAVQLRSTVVLRNLGLESTS